MSDESSSGAAPSEPRADERSIARKYGIRELVYPDREQMRALAQYLTATLQTGRSGPVPKTAVMVMVEFFQGTLNRQHITKGPRMTHDEYDLLQQPYYLAARIMNKVLREKRDEAVARGQQYQTTYLTLNHFIELLRSIIDPGCYWLRMKDIPDGVRELMDLLLAFAQQYNAHRSK